MPFGLAPDCVIWKEVMRQVVADLRGEALRMLAVVDLFGGAHTSPVRLPATHALAVVAYKTVE